MSAAHRYTAIAVPVALLAGLAAAPTAARADVTVQQQTSMSIAGMKIDIQSTERTTADKQRRDTITQCHGFLALFCHNVQGGEIVRLDKQLEWQLEPKRKRYTETAFPTPEQRAQAQRQLAAEIEEMKKCPMPQTQNTSQSAPDTSHCQLSPAKLDVKRTDEHLVLLGHDARKSSILLSQSCTDTQTGDVCEMDYGIDSWLTTDDVPGMSEQQAFTRSYLAAQGLDPNDPQLQGMMRQLMAPYADAFKQLQSRSGELKGHPLKTTFYMAFGGPHCGKAREAQQQQAQSSRGSGGLGFGNIASSAIRGGLGGLFHRGASNIDTGTVGGAAAAGAANQAADPAAAAAADAATRSQTTTTTDKGTPPAAGAGQLVQVITLTTETTAIDTSSIPADQFEIPAGWKLQPQREEKARQFSCPATAER
jgi:hypothetical protein